MQHICRDGFFLARNSQVTTTDFIRSLTVKSAVFPYFKMATF